MTNPSSTDPKTFTCISASVPPHVRARIEEAATWKGLSVGAFVADAAAKEAEQVIERQRLIQFAREDAELVAALLENPPTPNDALCKAAELHSRLIGG